MSDSLIQFPAMASGASFAGTCLMQTMMFMNAFLGNAKEPWSAAESLPSQQPHRQECLCYWRRRYYLPSQRRKISAALVPPKPKEFDSAYSTEALRAVFGT